MSTHEKRMQALIQYNKTHNPDGPYGCAIYSQEGGLLVSASGNHLSPVNHAEILAIDQCAKQYPNIKWDSLSLYTTGEPCCMCAAACCWANLKQVIYATGIPFMIELWGVESTLSAEFIFQQHPKKPKLIHRVCEAQSNQMFMDYKEIFSDTFNKHRWRVGV